MATLPPIVVELQAHAGELKAKLAEARGEITSFADHGSSKMKAFAQVGKAALLGVGGAAVIVGGFALEMADKFETAHAHLAVAIKNSGDNIGRYNKQLDAQSAQYAKLGYDTTTYQDALAILTTQTKNVHVAMADMSIAANIASARHMDLAKAAILVGKVQAGNTTVLKKFGIDLGLAAGGTTAAAKATVALTKAHDGLTLVMAKIHDHLLKGRPTYMALVAAQQKVRDAQDKVTAAHNAGSVAIDALSKRFAGNAQAASETFAGKVKALHAQINDLGIKLGMWLIPKIEALVGWILKAINWFQKHATVAKLLGIAIGGVLVVAIGAYIASMVAAAAATVAAMAPFLLITAAIALVAIGIYELVTHWSEAWDAIKNAVSVAWDWIKNVMSTAWDAVVEFMASIPGRILSALKSLGSLLVGWASAGFHALVAHLPVIVAALLLWWAILPALLIRQIAPFALKFIGWAKDAFLQLVAALPGLATSFLDWWVHLPVAILKLIAGFEAAYIKWLAHAFLSLVTHIPGIAQALFDWFTALPGKIISAIGDITKAFFQFGAGIIKAIIKGILSAPGAIGGAIKGIVGGALHSLGSIGSAAAGLLGFAGGGVVPGPTGRPQLAIVHGGERVLTPAQQRQRDAAQARVTNQTINVYVASNANPADIGREVAWAIRTT